MNIFRKKPNVKVTEKHDGGHGDHWLAVFGFDDQKHMEQEVMEIGNQLQFESKADRKTHIYRRKYGIPSAMAILYQETFITMFPALFTSKIVPVEIKEVIEWSHADGKEAQILGNGHGAFYLDFFAIDYCQNKKKYLSGGTLKVALAGLAYVIDNSEPIDVDDVLRQDICTYIPSPDRDRFSEFDFIGEVLSVAEIKFKSEDLLLLIVRIVNDNEEFDGFSLPMLVHPKNMKINEVSIGQRISGMFWLQGRILGH